jgi:hypothetical protein
MADAVVTPIGWERALMAAEKVKERLRRATKALDDAGVPYAVVGGNAVAEWVARVDEDAVRNTRDVDLLIKRGDLLKVRPSLESAGFIHQKLGDREIFIDGPQGRLKSVSIALAKKCGLTSYRLCQHSTIRSVRRNFKS